jgi:uncharacterized protein YbjT (DUF2867 family)
MILSYENTKYLRIGATGHIGGAVLDLISSESPELSVLALVRDKQKSERLVAKYPQVSTLIGDLESTELLETSSYHADVVIRKSTLYFF